MMYFTQKYRESIKCYNILPRNTKSQSVMEIRWHTLTNTACRRLSASSLSFSSFFFLRSSEERKKKTISNPLFINQQTSCSSVLIVLCNINNDNIRFSKDFRSYVSNFHKTNFPSCKVPCSSHLTFSCFKDVFLSLINLCSSLHEKLKRSNRKAA